MAGDWTNKVPNEPYVDSSGRHSVVLMREWPLETKSTIEQYNEMKTWDFMLEVAQDGLQRLSQKFDKKYNADTWSDLADSAVKPDENDAERFGNLSRAKFAGYGISKFAYDLGVRGFDLEGPFFPPRPGVGYGLYKFSVERKVFDDFGPEDYENRITQILAKGQGHFKEIEFDSYEDLGTQLAEVAAALEEYEGAHRDMQTQAADKDNSPQIFKGPELGDPPWPDPDKPRVDFYGPLNLTDEANRLNLLNAKIKEFLNLNGANIHLDKVIVGFYPVKPELNPAESLDDSEDAAAKPSAAKDFGDYNLVRGRGGDLQKVKFASMTVPYENPVHYTNQYKVQEGDDLWKITKYYLGAGGARYKDLIDDNVGRNNTMFYYDRGWRSTERMQQIKLEVLRMQQEVPGYKDDDQYLELISEFIRGELLEIKPGDIIHIPYSWLEEIANTKGPDWNMSSMFNSEGIMEATVVYEIGAPAPKTQSTEDGPPIAVAGVDPWDGYHADAGPMAELGRGRIAYFKLPSPTYSKAIDDYKKAEANLKAAAPSDKTLMSTRLENAKLHVEDIAIQDQPFKWVGFLDLVHSKPAQAPRTLHLLTNLDIVVGEPGISGALTRYCSPDRKPPKKAKKISAFVKKYIYDPPKAVAFEPTGEEAARNLFDHKARDHHTPKTEKETNAWNAIVKSPLMKTAIARRNQKFSDQAGDAVFASLPRHVDEWNSLDDIYRTVLSRLDLPVLAEELLKCLGLSLSINDIIEALCDGFLRKIGADPDKIDQFYNLLMSGEFNLSVEAMEEFELIDTAHIAAEIQKYFAEAVSAGVDDPFYSAVIKQNVNNASGKMLICELILSAMFAMADYLANLDGRPSHNDAVPPTSRCAVPPKIFLPKIPADWADIWYWVRKKLEQMLYRFLEELIKWPVKELLESLIDACTEDQPEFGAPPPPILPGKEEDLNRAFAGVGVESPRDFLAHLLSTLTQRELCELISGTAAPIILLHVRKFMRANYSEFYNLFSTDDKIFSFFKGLQGMLDLSFCAISPILPESELRLDDLCKDGVTPRQEALRRSLLAKGLSPDQVEEQLEIDRQIKKDLISSTVDAMFPSPLDDKLDFAGSANALLADSRVLKDANIKTVDTAFSALKTIFMEEALELVPNIKDKVQVFESPAGGNYDFSSLPVSAQMAKTRDRLAEDSDSGRGMSGLDNNLQHGFNIWIYGLKFTPGSGDATGTYTVQNAGWKSGKRIEYTMLEQDYSGVSSTADEAYFFTLKDRDPETESYSILFSAKFGRHGITSHGLSPAALSELKKYSNRTVHETLPKQVDVWLEFLKRKLDSMYTKLVSSSSPNPATADGWYGIPNLEINIANNPHPISNTKYPTRMLAQKIYNLAFNSLYVRVLNVVMQSPAMELSEGSENVLYGLKLDSLANLNLIVSQTHNKVEQLMRKTDFTSGEAPSYLGEAIFEGAAKCYIKIELLKKLVSSIPVFSKFKFDDAFSDPIMNEFINASFSDKEFYKNFLAYYEKQEAKLRRSLEVEGPLSRPPKNVLTDQQIVEKISEKLYRSPIDSSKVFTSPEDYFYGFAEETASTMKSDIMATINLEPTSIDEEVEAQEAGLIQIIDTLKQGTDSSPGTTSKNHGHTHTYALNNNGNGKTSKNHGHKHTVKGWTVKSAGKDPHIHLLEEKPTLVKPGPEIHSITTRNSDLQQKYEGGALLQSATRWRDSEYNEIKGNMNSTLMQQHFPAGTHLNPGNGGQLVELPVGTTIPPGTNYDSTVATLVPMSPSIVDGHGESDANIGLGASRWFSSEPYEYKHWVKPGGPSATVQVTAASAKEELLRAVQRARSDFDATFGGSYNPPLHIWEKLLLNFTGTAPYGVEANLSAVFKPISEVEYSFVAHKGLDDKNHAARAKLGVRLNNLPDQPASAYVNYDKSDVDGYYIEKKATHGFQTIPPQNAAQWAAYPGASAENPLIRLGVPTHGHDDIEVFTATMLSFTVNGKNFGPDTRVFFIGKNFGRSYEALVDWAEFKDPTKLAAHYSISSYGAYGASANREAYFLSELDESTMKTWSSSWTADQRRHNVKVRYGHGHIDEMAALGSLPYDADHALFRGAHSDSSLYVVDDIYYLVAQNPDTGKTGYAPIYFHTFKPYARAWNKSSENLDHYENSIPSRAGYLDALNEDGGDVFAGDTAEGNRSNNLAPQWRDKEIEWPNPEEHPLSDAPETPRLGPRPWEKLSAMNFQAFPLTVYGEDHERWDITDVADVIGIKQDYVGGEDWNRRQSILCKPRLVNKKYASKLADHGGFILEKYVNIKFKPESVLIAEGFHPDLIQRIYGAPEGTTTAFKDMVAISSIHGADLGAGSGYIGAANLLKQQIYADKFALAEFTDKPGLVVPAQNSQILSYDAFARLQQHLLGIPPDLDPASSEATVQAIVGMTSPVNEGLQRHFSNLLSDFSYGLRLSYVLPLRGVEKSSKTDDKLVGGGRFAAALRNMFSPTSMGLEDGQNNLSFDAVYVDQQLHLTKAKALNKALHMIEFEGTGIGTVIPGIYSMPPGDLATQDILGRFDIQLGTGEGETTLTELTDTQSWIYSESHATSATETEATTGEKLTAQELLDVLLEPSGWASGTVVKVQREVFVLPLVSVELREGEVGFPSHLETFQDLRRGYPTEETSEWLPDGKVVFNALYLKLRRNPEFKLLFEYIFPVKRMLALNTIYTMESFKDMFPGEDVLATSFKNSVKIARGLAAKTIQNPTGKIGTSEPPIS